tara:strand:+ start:3452 stop:3802 length:351 start_codon:yes stop_codon:yes gene_type:complete
MSCLFNSFSYFLTEDSFSIRQKICDYLENNGPIIEGLETNFILSIENSNYISNMRSTSTWGGAIEIQAACNIWNISVIVKNYRNHGQKNIEFLPLHGNVERQIYIYWTGGHYEPVK